MVLDENVASKADVLRTPRPKKPSVEQTNEQATISSDAATDPVVASFGPPAIVASGRRSRSRSCRCIRSQSSRSLAIGARVGPQSGEGIDNSQEKGKGKPELSQLSWDVHSLGKGRFWGKAETNHQTGERTGEVKGRGKDNHDEWGKGKGKDDDKGREDKNISEDLREMRANAYWLAWLDTTVEAAKQSTTSSSHKAWLFGFDKGHSKGYDSGYESGYAAGVSESMAGKKGGSSAAASFGSSAPPSVTDSAAPYEQTARLLLS